jgi:KDO2-lipid IV(A) lauroyltransferase
VARLLIGNSLRGVAERWPVVHRAIWAVEGALFALFLGICWLLPTGWAQRMAGAAMAVAGPRQPKHRHVRRNLELAFPDRSPREIETLGRTLWGNIGKVFAEYAHLGRIHRHAARRVDIIGGDYMTGLLRSGRAAVLVTAHVGNWEMIGCALRELGLPLTVVYTPLQNPYLDRLVARCRATHNARLLARDDSMRPMMRELLGGRSIGLIMDQRVDTGSPVPYFGIDKLTTLIPARLALRHGVDLLPVRTERLPKGRFRVTFCPPVRPDTRPGDAGEIEVARDMTARVNAIFEDWIRERPGDWFCTRRLWPKDAQPRRTARQLAGGSAHRA